MDLWLCVMSGRVDITNMVKQGMHSSVCEHRSSTHLSVKTSVYEELSLMEEEIKQLVHYSCESCKYAPEPVA